MSNTQQFEVETKWFADNKKVSRTMFNKFVWSVIESKFNKDWSFKTTSGPDYYYDNYLGHVARFRNGPDCKELTVKARLSPDDITVRIEHNVPLDLQRATFPVVDGYLRTSGYKRRVKITKTCDIYKFAMPKSSVHADVVWYKVSAKGHPDRSFIEVEVNGGTRQEQLQALKYWTTVLKSSFGLSDTDVCKDSLYELYTEKRYRVVQKR